MRDLGVAALGQAEGLVEVGQPLDAAASRAVACRKRSHSWVDHSPASSLSVEIGRRASPRRPCRSRRAASDFGSHEVGGQPGPLEPGRAGRSISAASGSSRMSCSRRNASNSAVVMLWNAVLSK